MTIYTVRTGVNGTKSVFTETENVASFGPGPQGQAAFAAWVEGIARRTRDAIQDDDTGSFIAGDVSSLA